MSFPLYVPTYTIGSRVYRRPPYKGKTKISEEVHVGDTPDLYVDEEHLDGPACQQEPAPKTARKEKFSNKKQEYTVKAVNKEEPPDNNSQNDAEWEVCEEDERITRKDNKWKTEVFVPSMFLAKLIGTNGRTRREMEDSTHCRLIIPRKGQNTPVVITSVLSLESVQRCLDRIEILVAQARQTAPYTHFPAVACNHAEVKEAYEMFKEAVITNDRLPVETRNDFLFTAASKLHVTICMLRVFDEAEKQKTKDILFTAGERIRSLTAGTPIQAEIEGLKIMNDDPSQVDVLYADVHGELLQQALEIVKEEFIASGLSPTEEGRDGVKMHMTLMNSRYASQGSGDKRTTFDATLILDELKDFHFGYILIEKIGVCCLHSNSSTGYYEEMCEVSLL